MDTLPGGNKPHIFLGMTQSLRTSLSQAADKNRTTAQRAGGLHHKEAVTSDVHYFAIFHFNRQVLLEYQFLQGSLLQYSEATRIHLVLLGGHTRQAREQKVIHPFELVP